jgi:putative endonuclease
MHFIYILKSVKSKKLYIGYTNNLRKRLFQHNSGFSKSTKAYVPWRLVYYEASLFEKEARQREKNLKLRANAWNQLKRRVKESLNID